MPGFYNEKAQGIITRDWITEVTKDISKDKYVIIRGYFDQGNIEKNKCMRLNEILNFMYTKGFEFSNFISRDEVTKTFGEMLFQNKDL